MSEALLNEAIQKFKLKVSTIHEVPESNSSIVRILELLTGEKVVLKRSWSPKKFRREKAALEKLKDHPLVPNLLDSFINDQTTALLLEYKNGLPISKAENLTKKMVAQIGEGMAQIHLQEMENFEGESDWTALICRNFRNFLNACKDFHPSHELDQAEALFFKKVAYLPPISQANLIHFDLRLGNILQREDKIIGIIDFESARGGSGDMDFYKLWKEIWIPYPSFKLPMINAYQSIKSIDMDLEMVLSIYAIYHAVAGISWCILRDKMTGPFYEKNKIDLQKALEVRIS